MASASRAIVLPVVGRPHRTVRELVGFVGMLLLATVPAGCGLSEALAEERAARVDGCCACLATRGTGHPEATCTEAVIVDGEITVPAGARYGNGTQSFEDNDLVDDGEIPCLCGDLDADGCVATLGEPAGRLVVPGACIAQVDRRAPCEDACGGVLAFVPLSAIEN